MTAPDSEGSQAVEDERRLQVDAYLNASLVRGQTEGTVRYRRVYLAQFVDWLSGREIREWEAVTWRDLEEHVVWLQTRRNRRSQAGARLSMHTVAAAVSVLRSFFAWLTTYGRLPADPAVGLKLGRYDRTPQRPVLSIAEVEALLDAPGVDAVGLRDRAILETFYSTGVRRAELCALDCYDVDFSEGAIQVRNGKGGRDRVVPVGSVAISAIRRYLRESRPLLLAGGKDPGLFVASITHQRISAKDLNWMILKYGTRAGIAGRVTPHVLRHTCATHLLQGGASIRDVQAILGHACIGTTQLYTRVSADDLVAVHARAHPRDALGVP